MRAWRLALALVVGLNLALICQGHDHGDQRLIPHLAMLGEPAHAGEVLDEAGHEGEGSLHVLGTSEGESAGANVPTLSFPPEIPSIVTLGVALFGLFVSQRRASCLIPSYKVLRLASQTALWPEAPPPRG